MLKIKKFRHKIAFEDPLRKKTISYNKLNDISAHVSKLIKANTVTLMFTENDFYCYPLYVAVINSKSIIVLLDYKLFKNEIFNLIDSFNANYVIVNDKIKLFDNCQKIYSLGNYLIYLTDKKKLKVNSLNKLLISTSGTSQKPKFVRLSKENILDNTKKIIKNLKIDMSDTTITTLPIAYSYGLSIINTHLLVGAKIVVNPFSIYEKNFWSLISKYKIKSFGAVPSMYVNLARYGLQFFYKSKLNYISIAGGELKLNLLRIIGAVCKLNRIAFIKMYGQTEASPRISHLDWKYFFKKISSVGKPLKDYKIKITNYTKKQSGEIRIVGKNVCLGYAKSVRELIKGDVNKKILKTGDYGYIDKDGFLFIKGRKKNFIKIFGIRININQIQKNLKSFNITAKLSSSNDILFVNLIKNEKKISNTEIKNILFQLTKINTNFILVDSKKNYSFK